MNKKFFLLLLTLMAVPVGQTLAQTMPAAPQTMPAAPAPSHPVPTPAAGSLPVSAPFRDVPRDHWAFASVEVLRKAGIVRGEAAGSAHAAKRKTR